MQILDVYKKAYKCRECDADVYYAKVADDGGKIFTTDGKDPNGKYGRDSNCVSVQVDVSKEDTIHKCFTIKAKQLVEEAEEKRIDPKSKPKTEFANIKIKPEIAESLKEFDELVCNAYHVLYDIAGRGRPGADSTSLHITTMGLMHDYFSFRLSKALTKA